MSELAPRDECLANFSGIIESHAAARSEAGGYKPESAAKFT
jgi:hypothetical protein